MPFKLPRYIEYLISTTRERKQCKFTEPDERTNYKNVLAGIFSFLKGHF